MKLEHEFERGKCKHCGCHFWEDTKPCKRSGEIRLVRQRAPKHERFADELPERDFYVGDSPDY